MTARKRARRNVSGYIWDRRLETALDDNNETRNTLSAIHDHLRAVNCANQVNLLLVSQLLTDAILSLDKVKDALVEIRTIAAAQTRALAGTTGPVRSTQPREESPEDASPT